MENKTLIIERTFQAPVHQVWQAITDKDAMKQWYFDFESFIPEKGFEFHFFGGTEDKQYQHNCKITEVIKEKKLTYSWSYEGYPGISFVTFELFAEGENTKLRLSHAGLESFPAENADFARKNFVAGWTELIDVQLKNYLEKSSSAI